MSKVGTSASSLLGLLIAIFGVVSSVYGGLVVWTPAALLAGIPALLTGVALVVHNYEAAHPSSPTGG